MNHPPQVIVTGLSGLVGQRLEALFQSKYDFHNLDLTTGVDITQFQSVNSSLQHKSATTLLHLAAFTDVTAAFNQSGDRDGSCYQVNVVGTRNIALAAQKYNLHLIHISTDFVFDGTKDTPYTEIDVPHPIEWYGQTKLWAETEVENSGCKYTIIRLAYPYQARPSRPDFLRKVIDQLNQNTLPPAFVDHVITPTFVDDFCQVLSWAIDHHPQALYHAVGSSSHSDYEIACLVKDTFNLKGIVKPGSVDEYLKTINRPYQKIMQVSNAKLTADSGLKLLSFQEGLLKIREQLTSVSSA